MVVDFFKALGFYIGFSIALVVIVKLVFSLWKKHISFMATIKPIILTASIATLLAFVLFEKFAIQGLYIGDLPKSYIVVQGLIVFLPITCVIFNLIWTVTKQLRRA
jgi:hypothetical protein